MRPEATESRLRGLRVLEAGLLAGGIALAIWLIGLVRSALFEPSEVPLLARLLSASEEIVVTMGGDRVEISGATVVLAVILTLFLLGSLGRIVEALLKGGVSLLGRTYGLGGEKQKRENHD